MTLRIPPTATNLPEWLRKAAGLLNSLATLLGAYGSDTTVSGSYTVQAGDYLVRVDASGGAATVSLPAAEPGRQIIVKKTDSSGNTVTIDAAGSELIDGAGTKAITAQWQTYSLLGYEGGWAII